MRQIDLLLLEDAMRRGVVATNSTARSFQLAALLLVGACVLFVLAHDMAHRNISIGGPQANTGTEPSTFAGYPVLYGSEAYRGDKCAGDYVCDEDGSWETIAVGAKAVRNQR